MCRVLDIGAGAGGCAFSPSPVIERSAACIMAHAQASTKPGTKAEQSLNVMCRLQQVMSLFSGGAAGRELCGLCQALL